MADKVYRLFHETESGAAFPPGESLLNKNLDGLCVRDDLRHSHNHNAQRIQVEAALLATLKEENIPITLTALNCWFR